MEIEQGIAIPNRPTRGILKSLPFEKMNVGDSFVVELGEQKSWGHIYEAIQRAQIKFQIKLTTRLVEPGKRRIWRTE